MSHKGVRHQKGVLVDEAGRARKRTLNIGGVLLGLGLGGFFDGIVLHQILQWHHMVSNERRWPLTTVEGLKANTLGDGLFHAATWIFTVAGVALLWRALSRPNGSWSTKHFVGLLLMGWGTFNLVEGVVDHVILQVHHVRENSSHQAAWDLGFLVWGAAMLIGGWLLARSGERARIEREGLAVTRRSGIPTR